MWRSTVTSGQRMPCSRNTCWMLAPAASTSRTVFSPDTLASARSTTSSSMARGTTRQPSTSPTTRSPSFDDDPADANRHAVRRHVEPTLRVGGRRARHEYGKPDRLDPPGVPGEAVDDRAPAAPGARVGREQLAPHRGDRRALRRADHDLARLDRVEELQLELERLAGISEPRRRASSPPGRELRARISGWMS